MCIFKRTTASLSILQSRRRGKTSRLLHPCSDFNHLNSSYSEVHDFLWQLLALNGFVCSGLPLQSMGHLDLFWGCLSQFLILTFLYQEVADISLSWDLCWGHVVPACCCASQEPLPISFPSYIYPTPPAPASSSSHFLWEWFLSPLNMWHNWPTHSISKTECQVLINGIFVIIIFCNKGFCMWSVHETKYGH